MQKGVSSAGVSPSGLEVASSYLLDFFTAGGRSVLVRGDPGTGKTSLVLQLLDFHSKNGFKSVYMSTRLSAKTLKSHQPWVEVVQGKYGTVPRLEEEQIGFQDSRRMDGVRAISGLRQYLEQVTNPFVVLDSWEGLFFESHTLGVEEISKLVEDYDARFVVVTERREQTDLDYLLDGVVVLRRKFHEERIVREIELKKLRGVSIKQSRFLFTLDSGKFRYLPPFSTGENSSQNAVVGEPTPSSKPGYYSTGSDTLDSLLNGGFRRSSLNLLELKDDVPLGVIELILRTIFSNFANTGHNIMYVPIVGGSKEDLERILPNISKETLESRITSFGYQTKEKPSSSSLKGDFVEDIKLVNQTAEALRKESGKPVLVVVNQDALEGLYGSEIVSRDLARSIALLKNNESIRLQMIGPHSALLSELRALCDANLRIEMIHGTPVLFTVKPISVFHAVIKEPVQSGRLGLIPIV